MNSMAVSKRIYVEKLTDPVRTIDNALKRQLPSPGVDNGVQLEKESQNGNNGSDISQRAMIE